MKITIATGKSKVIATDSDTFIMKNGYLISVHAAQVGDLVITSCRRCRPNYKNRTFTLCNNGIHDLVPIVKVE